MPRLGFLIPLAIMVAALTSPACAAAHKTFTNPAKAGPDYEAQGEYRGELNLAANSVAYGAQIIALGDGKFEAVAYEGGLPGEGWKRGDRKERVAGQRDAAKTVTFVGPNWRALIQNGRLVVSSTSGSPLGTLERVERKSPTLGAKPPARAIVLSGGKPGDEFSNVRPTSDGFEMTGPDNPTTRSKVRDYELHVEFRTPFMPTARGQARGNSGVFQHDRYEVQVLDSFGLEGENNECGGIYSIKEPEVNMCLPPLSWQTYDIRFTAARYDAGKKTKNARATVEHNGVKVHDDVEIPQPTAGGSPEDGTEEAPIRLNWHGDPVQYRNIWIVPR